MQVKNFQNEFMVEIYSQSHKFSPYLRQALIFFLNPALKLAITVYVENSK